MTEGTGTGPANPEGDTISISCPPLPGGGVSLQPNFKVCGNWSSNATNPKVTCQYITTGGNAFNGVVTSSAQTGTWSAPFNIPAPYPVKGKVHAAVVVNGVPTATADAPNLQVIQTGGGTCTC